MCVGGDATAGDKAYFYSGSSLATSASGAIGACRQNGREIATFRSREEFDAIVLACEQCQDHGAVCVAAVVFALLLFMLLLLMMMMMMMLLARITTFYFWILV